ncbi:MAG: GerMN domain-containing protein [Ilumatobacteraceae bacterium]
MRRIHLAALLAVTALVATACGVKNDSAPRDIPEAEQVDLVSPQDQNAGEATGTQRIYLVGPETNAFGAVLEGVPRAATSPKELMESLLAGANADEVAQQLRSAIPVGTRLLAASPSGGTMRVDLSEEILQLSGSDLADALAQIVFTASEWPNVAQVRVLVDGAAQQWPIGDGTLQSTSLDVYDYPGRVASSQPEYPATPPAPQP